MVGCNQQIIRGGFNHLSSCKHHFPSEVHWDAICEPPNILAGLAKYTLASPKIFDLSTQRTILAIIGPFEIGAGSFLKVCKLLFWLPPLDWTTKNKIQFHESNRNLFLMLAPP